MNLNANGKVTKTSKCNRDFSSSKPDVNLDLNGPMRNKSDPAHGSLGFPGLIPWEESFESQVSIITL